MRATGGGVLRGAGVLRAGAVVVSLVVIMAGVMTGPGAVAAPTVAAPMQLQNSAYPLTSSTDSSESTVAASEQSSFDAGNIMSDAVFFDKTTMTESQIQAFFLSKVPSCRSGHVCLINFRADTFTREATPRCARYEGAAGESAARIVYKVAQACNINPRVLIVMLQKEQGLVTKSAPGTWEWQASMGYGCPDTAPCATQYYGFYNQVYLAAAQMQRYTQTPDSWNFRAGRYNNIGYHPNTSCGSSSVYIDNQATANLYIYTPYQPNAAALAAGYGLGNSCSAYGNRNFYNYFTDWFGSTQVSANMCSIFGAISSETRQFVTTAVLNARKAPRVSCTDDVFQLPAGTAVQALRSTSDGDWVEVRTLNGPRWVSSDFLDLATPEESACTLPAGTTTTNGVFVVDAATSLKTAPWQACEHNALAAGVGTVVQATRVSATGNWFEVQTQSGARWVERSVLSPASESDIDAACVAPSGTSEASGEYVVTTRSVAWLTPLTRCGVGQLFETGSVLQATRISYTGNWIEVLTQSGLRWIPRASLQEATPSGSDAACASPAGTSPTAGQYVVREDETLWTSPLVRCGTGTLPVSAGTVVQATQVSATGSWLEVQTHEGPRWIRASAVDQCAAPGGTREAVRQYIVRSPVSGLVSPLSQCGTGAAHWGAGTEPVSIAIGTVVQATQVSYTGNWLQIRTSTGPRWVRSAAVEMCAEPAATRPASKRYVVTTSTTALVSPLSECGTAAAHWGTGTAPLRVGAGTVVQAIRISHSGQWLKVETRVGPRWIRSEFLQVR